MLPVGTQMSLEHGVAFTVTSCVVVDIYCYLVQGQPMETTDAGGTNAGIDNALIKDGFLYPKVGWMVTAMNEYSDTKPLTYLRQFVPPPQQAWISENSSDTEILFLASRQWKPPESDHSVPLSTNRMHELSLKAHRIRDMDMYIKRLDRLESVTTDKVNNFVVDPLLTDKPPPKAVTYSEKTKLFVKLNDTAKQELYLAGKYDYDVIRHVHPGAGSVDQMFA